MKPVRMRLSRRKGFDLQAASRALNDLAAVPVARPTKWGNPFAFVPGRADSAAARAEAVACFGEWLAHGPADDPRRRAILDGVGALRGRNLACWCSLDGPCHADHLLRLANAAEQDPDQ